jgi:hypothetical protein
VFVTADRNLPFQQRLDTRAFATVVRRPHESGRRPPPARWRAPRGRRAGPLRDGPERALLTRR